MEKLLGKFVTLFFFISILSISATNLRANAEEPAAVASVTANVHISSYLPDPIKERIRSTVEQVGLKAYKGKSIDEADSLKDSLTQVMKKIFDEVLSGFNIVNLTISSGTNVTIDLYLEAKTPKIESVKIDVTTHEGINPFWSAFFNSKTAGVAEELGKNLAGIPVESARWSTPLLQRLVAEKIESKDFFPGFSVNTAVTVDAECLVTLDIKPNSPTIRLSSVKVRSTTIPSLITERFKYNLAGYSDYLLGLPIIFAKQEESFITKDIEHHLSEDSFAQFMGLKYEVKLLLQGHSLVNVVAESSKYSGFTRVKVSLGKENRNPDAEGHIGVFFMKDTELFTEINFFPGPVEMQMNIGAGHRFGDVYAAGGRNFIDGLNRAWISYFLTEDIILSYEKNVSEISGERNEGSITFKAHDFFSIDLVTDLKTDIWLRFNANL